jgi:putative FmdB family regulatory protein
MPVFDYQCTECGRKYDVYHKVREVEDDVVCPVCGSKTYKRLMSLPNVSISGGSSKEYPSSDDFSGGDCDSCCNNGMCGMN